MTRQRASLQRLSEKIARARPRHLLIGAAALHLALSLAINLAGRFNLLPSLFDQDGISPALAYDSFLYRNKAIESVNALAGGHFGDWFNAPLPFHVKLYSLSFAALSPLFGFTMLSVEPLNLLYYLLIVTLIFKIGEETFDRRTALLASAIVALWPSFLLHTTQLLRDPLFIVMALYLVLVVTRWLTKELSFRRAMLEALAGAAASAIVWLTRYNMWALIICITIIGVVLLIIRQIVGKRWLMGNLAGALLLLVTMTSAPTLIGKFLPSDTFFSPSYTAEQLRQQVSPCPEETTEDAATITKESGIWQRLLAGANARVAVLGKYRRRFALYYPEAGSNIDVCVRLESVGDLVRYLPRAAAHGFFAPYPDMWLKRGSTVGLSGRLLSGMETVGMYLIELLAILSLWKGRRRLPIWFIALVAITGIVAHGLVILNVAVLFRMRYIFSMLLIILGAGGAMRFFSPLVQKRSSAGDRHAPA